MHLQFVDRVLHLHICIALQFVDRVIHICIALQFVDCILSIYIASQFRRMCFTFILISAL